MAQKTVQIADKPTLDEVATDVEVLKAELASMSELVTSISKKVGVVEPAEGETVQVIGVGPVPFEYREGVFYGPNGATISKSGVKKLKIRLSGSHFTYVQRLIVDGVTFINKATNPGLIPFCTYYESDYTHILEIDCKDSISISIYSTHELNVPYTCVWYK